MDASKDHYALLGVLPSIEQDALVGGERPQQIGPRPHDPDFALSDLKALRERAKMIAAVAPIRAA